MQHGDEERGREHQPDACVSRYRGDTKTTNGLPSLTLRVDCRGLAGVLPRNSEQRVASAFHVKREESLGKIERARRPIIARGVIAGNQILSVTSTRPLIRMGLSMSRALPEDQCPDPSSFNFRSGDR